MKENELRIFHSMQTAIVQQGQELQTLQKQIHDLEVAFHNLPRGTPNE